MPAIDENHAGRNNANKKLSLALLVGGSLITVANALMQLEPAPRRDLPKDESLG